MKGKRIKGNKMKGWRRTEEGEGGEERNVKERGGEGMSGKYKKRE